MNPHTLINVYQDPMTKLHLEGPADLRQFEWFAADGLERWRVHFVADHPSETYSRLVDPADVIETGAEAPAAIARAEPK